MCSHDYYNTQFNYFTLLQTRLNWTDEQLFEHAFKLGVVFADLCNRNNNVAPDFETFYNEIIKQKVIENIEVK
jgi:hypothetical protein